MSRYSLEYQLQPTEQLCFLHIPKTAGTTLTAILESKFDRPEICPAEMWGDLKDYTPEKLATYRLIRGHFLYDICNYLPQKPVFVTMLRDPIDRIISAYEFMKTCIPIRPEAILTQEKARSMTLKEFVCDPSTPAIVNDQTRHLSRDIRGQYPDLKRREWLEIAQENLADFAFFGLTEQFNPSMSLLTYTFGWQPIAEFQNLMVGDRKTKRSELAQDVIDAIAERNQLDMELYAFGQNLFAQRYAEMQQALDHAYPETRAQLDRHYATRYAQIHLEPTSSLSLNFNQAYRGVGWHNYEGFGRETAFRWIGPGTTANLDFTLAKEQDLTLEFRVLNWITLDVLESLTVEVNGHPIPISAFHRDEATILFQGQIDRAYLLTEQPFTRLTFKVARTLSPQSLNPNSPDRRKVGVALDLVQIFPIHSSPPVDSTAFLFDSQPWIAAVEFLQTHVQSGETLFAPAVFRRKFAPFMPENSVTRFDASQRLQNYDVAQLANQAFQWIVIHKGMNEGRLAILKTLFSYGFAPVFANDVFVICQRRAHLSKLSYFAKDVRSIVTKYLKDEVKEAIAPISKLSNYSKFYAKQNLEPERVERLRSVYQKYIKK
jgi:hypothetical protein